MPSLIAKIISEDDGQDLIEYALLGVLVAILSVAVFPSIPGKMKSAFSGWASSVEAIWVPNDPQ